MNQTGRGNGNPPNPPNPPNGCAICVSLEIEIFLIITAFLLVLKLRKNDRVHSQQ